MTRIIAWIIWLVIALFVIFIGIPLVWEHVLTPLGDTIRAAVTNRGYVEEPTQQPQQPALGTIVTATPVTTVPSMQNQPPAAPQVGTTSNGYVWNGQYWVPATGAQQPQQPATTGQQGQTSTGTTGGEYQQLTSGGGGGIVTATPQAQPPQGGVSAGACAAAPTNLESLPRYPVSSAPLGVWFHPVYKQSLFQSSGGKDGQWSWFHTLCLIQADGGQFIGFEGNDGSFNFRMNQAQARVGFAVATTAQWKSQFLEGQNFNVGMNIRSMPGTSVNITSSTGKSASQAVSPGGDITIIEPDSGLITVQFNVNDPAMTHEEKIWFGPYDRSKGINTFDAR